LEISASVGFIEMKFIMMHGHMNIKKSNAHLPHKITTLRLFRGTCDFSIQLNKNKKQKQKKGM
jgi:hypothetical protein